jgi:hypothetical protein
MEQRAGLSSLVLVLGMASSACRHPAPPPSDEWGPAKSVPSNSATSNPSPTPGAAGSAPSANTPEPPGVVVQAAPAVTQAPPSTDEAVIDVGGQPTRITRDTVLTIRTALLEQIEKSRLLHKQELLEQTRNTTIGFGPKMARFGLWVLTAQGDSVQLIFRQPSNAPVVPYYRADVLHQADQWQVENLQLASMRRAH